MSLENEEVIKDAEVDQATDSQAAEQTVSTDEPMESAAEQNSETADDAEKASG